ncbi:MAG TPA: choice-of-anchor tandem repeat GloVer-containing protein [Verrucomicrobiae bacterium]|nr:choice-of-anchor tandem repeat GloVer-containing protein [Verrucomicrobiae bacterium]
MNFSRTAFIFIAAATCLLAGSNKLTAADLITVEAEAGALGGNFEIISGTPTYITSTTDGSGGSPGGAARVASYSITFPAPGIYKLYARVRVGPQGANDDSFFYGNGFGIKSPTSDVNWILINSIDVGGFANAGDVVAGNGSLGINVWKWINFSDYTGAFGEPPISFSVSADSLTQTFQIGARENGLDIDKLVFGSEGTPFTVAELDNGIPNGPSTNAFPGPDGVAIHRFSPLINGNNPEGANPAAGLGLLDGVLFGTTLNGGAQGAGTTFSVSLDGTNFNLLHSFTAVPDVNHPQGQLLPAENQFFGTGFAGGNNEAGAVFVADTNGSVLVLRNFSKVNPDAETNSGGASPVGTLVMADARLFGTASAGGAAGNGTIFSMNTNGTDFSVLHDFSLLDSQSGTNIDGAAPWDGLILSGNKLFGIASAGGAGGCGVVFSIETNGNNFTTLHSFSPMNFMTASNADGAIPYGGLVLSNGIIYGTTFAGGSEGRGTIFSLQTNGSDFTALHHFSATDPVTRTNVDGVSPASGLILSSNILYGTASSGGAGAAGTVFSFNLNDRRFATIHSFTALSGNATNADGAFPVGSVLRFENTLYGTTFSGGPGAAGTVFAIPLPPTPAIITNIIRQANGNVMLHFVGAPNSTNVIQSTPSLTPPVSWQNVFTNVADVNGVWEFADSNNTSTRFYRSYTR